MEIKLVIYGIVTCCIFVLFYYIYDLKKENDILITNNTKLEFSLSEQKKLLEQKEKDMLKKDEINNRYREVVNTLETEKSELLNKFNKTKTVTVEINNKKTTIQKNRDIGKLAVSKPKMVQNVINKGTIKEFRCLEQITNPNFSDYTKGASECK